jgi:hypothetical protein
MAHNQPSYSYDTNVGDPSSQHVELQERNDGDSQIILNASVVILVPNDVRADVAKWFAGGQNDTGGPPSKAKK